MGLILALISYVGWGTGDIFGAIVSRKIGAYQATAYVYLFGFFIASLYLPFALSDFSKITFSLFVLNFSLGAAYMIGNFFINQAFKNSSVSLVGIIVQSFPAVVLILSALIFKDMISLRQIIWIAIIFLGVFLCTVDFRDLKKGELFADKGIRYALCAAAIFSIYFTFLRVFQDVYGWFLPNYIAFMSFPLVLILIKRYFHMKEQVTIPRKKILLLAAFLSALLLRSGDIALNYGVGNGLAAIVAPIAGASPTLFIVLSFVIFKDKITNQQKTGMAFSLIGILLLSFFST